MLNPAVKLVESASCLEGSRAYSWLRGYAGKQGMGGEAIVAFKALGDGARGKEIGYLTEITRALEVSAMEEEENIYASNILKLKSV